MRRWTRILAIIVAGASSTAVLAAAASAAEVVLVTTAAVEQIMKGVIPTFETSTGNTVRMSVDGTATAVAKVLDSSYHPDLVLLGPDPLGELAKAGKVDGATITPAFRSRIGFAVRAGAPKPDISTPEGFKKALLDAKSIGYSIGPSGEYFSKVLIQRLGIADALKDKIKKRARHADRGCRRTRRCRSGHPSDRRADANWRHRYRRRIAGGNSEPSDLRHRHRHERAANRRRPRAVKAPVRRKLGAGDQEERHGAILRKNTLPWRGRVGARSATGWGGSAAANAVLNVLRGRHPHPAAARPTSPQGGD